MKEIFVIIQALCRASLTSNLEVSEFQIGRLVPALEKAGYQKEAASISRLLKSANQQQQANPVSLQLASSISGEPLTSKVPIPTDKETGAPLLEVIFPEQLPQAAPIFDEEIKDGQTMPSYQNYRPPHLVHVSFMVSLEPARHIWPNGWRRK